MMMTKKWYATLISFLFILLVSSIIASSGIGRFQPTHMIVKQVFCISCHPDEENDLERGRHVNSMNDTQNRFLTDYLDQYGNQSEPIKSVVGPCYTCHVTYQNYQLFGLTDPYVFNDSNGGLSSQYGSIIYWPIDNLSIPGWIFDNSNTTITTELEILSIEPVNFSVDSTVKIIMANYSGQQTGNISYDNVQVLNQGDTMVVRVENISQDYFKVIVILDGLWNSTTVNLRINGTDKSTESFFFTANIHPFVYEAPFSSNNGAYYFKTNGTYKIIRLDYVWSEWKNYSLGNITTSEIIQTNNTGGWINASTCSAPDGMCHINQRTTYMGMNDGVNPDRSFFPHRMRATTSLQCKLCHLNRMII